MRRTWPVTLLTLLVLSGSACVQSELTLCGESLCPTSTVCYAEQCVAPAAVAACAPLADGMPCNFEGVTLGECEAQICVAVGCGTGRINHASDEACADTNRDAGDGCNADCTSNEQCGNGYTDVAQGEACDDGNADDADDCHRNCQLPRCGDGIVDTQRSEQCDLGAANSQDPGAMCRRDCTVARCGDGIIDSAEYCDDGNQRSGDGCSFDCLSGETCGNDYVDFATGETCDDRRTLAADGCSNTCEREILVSFRAAAQPGQLIVAVQRAQDTLALRRDEAGALQTWLFDEQGWRVRTDALLPSAATASLAYDVPRQRVIAVLGQGSTFATWAFDGSQWFELVGTTAMVPGPIAYDRDRDRVVLTNELGTWLFDGTAWLRFEQTPRSCRGLGYLPQEHAIACVGSGSARLTATGWVAEAGSVGVYSGNSFEVWSTAQATFALANGCIAFGGTPVCSTRIFRRNTGQWQLALEVSGLVQLAAKGNALVGYEGATLRMRGTLVDTGGSAALENNFAITGIRELAYLPRNAQVYASGRGVNSIMGEMWEAHDGFTWRPIARSMCPQSTITASFSELFVVCDETSTARFDGTAWRVDLVPDETRLTALAGDVVRDTAYGFDGTKFFQFASGAWTELAPFPGLWRQAPALAVLPTGMVVLHGGTNLSGAALSDTWTFAQGSWTDVTATAGTPPPVGARLTTDWVRGVAVASLAGNGADAYHFDGVHWNRERVTHFTVTPALTYRSSTASLISGDSSSLWQTALAPTNSLRERCELGSEDSDADGAVGCDDPDCWWRCDPRCPPSLPVAQCDALRPRCGDGVCQAPLENPAICSSDCTSW